MSAMKSVLGEALDTKPRPGRRNRRFTSAQRRADIIRVATLLISERGYFATTLQAVAQECNMSRAGLLHYFASMDELIIAVMKNRDEVDLNTAGIIESEEFIDDPRQRLDALVERNSRQPELVRLYTVLNIESLNPEHPAHDYFDERYASSIKVISHMLDGHFDDPKTVAADLIAVMDGIQMQWLRLENVDLLHLWHPLADAVFAGSSKSRV